MRGARPTVHASNFKITNITCHSLQLEWANGDGAARLIVASEGAPTSWKPSDKVEYTPNSNFGKGTSYSGNYVVSNNGYLNFIVIDSLKTGKTYYFTIYEHDNANTSTLYYTANSPATASATVYVINMDYSVKFLDSCEGHNLFEFTNNSNSTMPGISYTYDFGDGNSASGSPVKYSYKTKSGPIDVRLTASPGKGCVNKLTRRVRVYPKKVAYIDFSKFDSAQCINSNYFEIDPVALITPLPKSFTYNWDFGDGGGISTFKRMKKTYKKAGHFKVEVEIVTYVNIKPTGCRDTLRFDLNVLPNPVLSISNSDTVQCLKNNMFAFSNSDLSLTNYEWAFGDDNSGSKKSVTHTYLNAGIYNVVHSASSAYGCKSSDTLKVIVAPSLSPAFNGLDTSYCASNRKINLTTVTSFGTFSGYPVNGNILIPDKPGNYTLKYLINLSNCSDSTSKNFRIKVSPIPKLGKDTLILNNQSLALDAGSATTYKWNTGETSRTKFVNGQTTPKGSAKYSVISTNSIGCSGYDTIKVSIDFETSLKNVASNTLLVYPNPVMDILTIANPMGTEFQWVIFNAVGQKIISGDHADKQIDMSGKLKGMYFLTIITEEITSTLQLIRL